VNMVAEKGPGQKRWVVLEIMLGFGYFYDSIVHVTAVLMSLIGSPISAE